MRAFHSENRLKTDHNILHQNRSDILVYQITIREQLINQSMIFLLVALLMDSVLVNYKTLLPSDQNQLSGGRSVFLLTDDISVHKLFYQLASRFQSQVLRSEEHTSELQSRFDLVCRLLLEKKK